MPLDTLQQTALDHLAEGVVALSGERLRIAYANRTFSSIFGLEGELAGRSLTDVLPGIPAAELSRLRRVMDSGEPKTLHEHACPFGAEAGATRYWNRRYVPTEIDGEPGVLILCLDVTAQVQARRLLQQRADEAEQQRQTLAQLEARLSLALAAAPITIFSRDRQLRLNWVYQPTARADSFHMGRHSQPADLYEPADAGLLADIYRSVLTSGKPLQRTLQLRSPGFDRPRWFELFVQPEHDADGAVSGVAVASFDVTKYQEVKRTLAEREGLLRMTLDAAGMADWQYDLVSGELQHSAALLKLHELPQDYRLPNPRALLARIQPEDRRVARRALASALASGELQVKLRYRVPLADGAVRWLIVRCRIVRDGAGRPLRLLGIHTDISHEQGRYEELRRSHRELERFAYAASHDLKEPLRTISAFSSLLERRLQGRLSAEEAGFFDYIRNGSREMQELVDGLLAYAQASAAPREWRPVALDRMVEACLRDLRAALSETGAQIERQPLPVVAGNATLLRNVVQNLLSNALKFSAGEAPRIRLSAQELAGEWRIAVADNGIGIPPHLLERVFEPFLRVHGRPQRAGSGLGLALAKRAVDEHGGRIWAEAAPAGGTVFYFTLPKRAPATPAP